MSKYNESTTRNVLFVSHSGAGKTALVEAILNGQGMTTRLGTANEGNTVSDFDPIEIDRKISVNVSLMHAIVGDAKINLIDSPGYADFIMELLYAISAADTGVLVVSAYDGIEVGTQRAWDILEKNNLPRVIYISKIDKDNTNFDKTVSDIQENFGKQCIPVFVPSGNSGNFKATAKLLARTNWDALPADVQERAEKYRENLIEQIAVVDDALVEKYLNGEELTQDEIYKAFDLAINENKVVPIFCGNARTGVGIKEMTNAIIKYFPSPADRGLKQGVNAKSPEEIVQVEPKTDKPFSGYVFKTISDPYVGQLSVFRVLSGELKSNTEFYNVTQESNERIGQLYALQGKEQLPVDSVGAGDIAAVAKLKNTHTGDSIGNSKNPILYVKDIGLEPAISFSLKPKTRQDEEKISASLAKLIIEDQGIKVSRDTQTKELILSGMGDQHLEITIER
ncbi:MAG: GTP-binding protein, partial [Candidatus Heimdallarchaeota archaeon]|nr:GTP-binding protein [Candidatus Heimdallarchaeota archaeon]